MTNLERQALERLAEQGGTLCWAAIPEKTEGSTVGEPVPGRRVYQRLADKGLVVVTTGQLDLTDEGWAAMAQAA